MSNQDVPKGITVQAESSYAGISQENCTSGFLDVHQRKAATASAVKSISDSNTNVVDLRRDIEAERLGVVLTLATVKQAESRYDLLRHKIEYCVLQDSINVLPDTADV